MFANLAKIWTLLISLKLFQKKEDTEKNVYALPTDVPPYPEEWKKVVNAISDLLGFSWTDSIVDFTNFSSSFISFMQYVRGIKEPSLVPEYVDNFFSDIEVENFHILDEILAICRDYIEMYAELVSNLDIKPFANTDMDNFYTFTGMEVNFHFKRLYGNVFKATAKSRDPLNKSPYDGVFLYIVTIPSGDIDIEHQVELAGVKVLPILFSGNEYLSSFSMVAFKRYFDNFNNVEQNDIAVTMKLNMVENGIRYSYQIAGNITNTPFIVNRKESTNSGAFSFSSGDADLRNNAIMTAIDLSKYRVNFAKSSDSYEKPVYNCFFKLR